ncbi:MAG: ATP-binding protein [Patescibacteria group bacterium]
MPKITGEILKRVITEQRENFLNTEGYIEREILTHPDFTSWCSLKEIIVITGVRRSGKSFLFRLIWKKIQAQRHVASSNFLYVNFDDEKMVNFTTADFDLLLESYYELFAVDHKQKIFLFFDEIQNIVGWEKFLNRMRESRRFKIFVTGSNATLLSKEISSALTGRNFSLTLFPLSFREFVNYKDKTLLDKNSAHLTENRARVKKWFEEYLTNGGFPEVVLNGYRPLLQEYLKNIIYRDIVLRRRIRREFNLREIVSFVISNIGVILSLDNIAKMTRVKNLMTVKNYLGYLEDSFLFFNLPRHSYSVKNQIYNPDKFFAIDTGLYHEVAVVSGANEGRLLENIVFLQLKRQQHGVFYFKEKNECDFVVQKKNKITSAIQVTKILDTVNKNREVSGLLEALEKFNLKNGLILTLDTTQSIKQKNVKIEIMPIWQWLLYV